MSETKYTWTQINETSVDVLRRMVVDLGNENPEFIGMSKKQKPFLIQALWNYFMSTGQASFEDASDDENEFNEFSDLDTDDFTDPADDDWSTIDPDANGFAEVMDDPQDKSKKLDTDISHMLFSGMVSNGPNVSNITVTVSAGAMTNNYPVVGKSIYEVEKMLGQFFNVNPYARIVLVNGDEVTNDYIIKENDVVEFVNEAYDKG